MLVGFTDEALREYYNSQITNLNKNEKTNETINKNYNYDEYLNNIPPTPDKDSIGRIISELKTLLSSDLKLDYSHQIKKIKDEHKQRICWIVRLQIFISILIAVINDIKTTKSLTEKIQIELYELGIFGSDKSTSDIDVGIQFVANQGESNLSELVKIIEDKFMSFGYRTLDFDIEFYGDLLTITKLVNFIPTEYLYLSNTDFACEEFLELLPYCGASIYRNYLHRKQSEKVVGQNHDTFIKEFSAFCEKYISQILSKNTKHTPDTLNILFALLRGCINHPSFTRLFMDVETYMYPKIDDKLVDKDDLNLIIFDKQRGEYYNRIKQVETIIYKDKYQSIVSNNKSKLDKSDILEIIRGIGNALIYREESYVCVPTIIHVVRIIQAKSNNAIRTMGNYGYLISILEQCGYLFRFEDNDTKFEKYNVRLINGLDNIQLSEALEYCITSKLLDIAHTSPNNKRTLRRNSSRSFSSMGIASKKLKLGGGRLLRFKSKKRRAKHS